MAKHDIVIHTDGGAAPKNPGIGGWGAVLKCSEINYMKEICGGYKLSTNNRMEMSAVIEALKALNPDSVKSVTIYADSSYVTNAFNKKWLYSWKKSKWKDGTLINMDLWIELSDLADIYKPKFIWIPREKNTHADALSRKGRECDLLTDFEYERIAEAKRKAKEEQDKLEKSQQKMEL